MSLLGSRFRIEIVFCEAAVVSPRILLALALYLDKFPLVQLTTLMSYCRYVRHARIDFGPVCVDVGRSWEAYTTLIKVGLKINLLRCGVGIGTPVHGNQPQGPRL
jgi:hypothetical protein